MKADTLRDLSPAELEAKSDELREQLLKLRFQQTTGQIESPQMLRSVRKDIARVMTILREKELGLAVPSVPVEAQTTVADEDTETEDGTIEGTS
ncbi:MAG: 50S ribosomal protein L29 [Acidobacteria bacterium]|nr:50S ribosomal protein L29 [Acidobacteriota bacterium]